MRRWWIWLVAGILVLVIAAGAWLAMLALGATSELQAAIPLASEIKKQVIAGDAKAAIGLAELMARHTNKARENANSPIWEAAELLPVVGPNLSAVWQLANAADDVVVGTAVPLAEVASTLNPSALKPVDGAIDVKPFVAAQSKVAAASAVISAAATRLDAIDTSALLAPVSGAVHKLASLLSDNAPALHTASTVLDVVPGALGASEPRNYLLVFQNNAEIMPRGGTIGNAVLIHVEGGRIELQQ